MCSFSTSDERTTSTAYFSHILSLGDSDQVRHALLSGIASSAGGGSESVLLAARAALGRHVLSLDLDLLRTHFEMFLSLLQQNLAVDRFLVSILEVLAFLMEVHAFDRLHNEAQLQVILRGTSL